jgi:hypothetical protein
MTNMPAADGFQERGHSFETSSAVDFASQRVLYDSRVEAELDFSKPTLSQLKLLENCCPSDGSLQVSTLLPSVFSRQWSWIQPAAQIN